jgi:signal transduction histidine kinase
MQTPIALALMIGPEHRIEVVNAAYRRLSRGGRDITGLTAREAFPELEGQPFFELLDRVYATGEPWAANGVSVRHDRDGTGVVDTFFDLRYQPIRDADGRMFAILNSAVDVTDQTIAHRAIKAAEVERERLLAAERAARAEAEAASRAKSEFLAVMSHELRTPLNAIGGYAELLEMGIRGPVTEQQCEDLRRIQKSQKHLLGLINEVLNYTRLETGAVHYELTDVPVDEILATVEPLVRPQLRAKGLAYVSGGCDPALRVRADPEKLQQILLNLLSNAIKFTRTGGRVEISCEAEEREVAIHVADTGRGIPADKLQAVFEPFVQVDARLTRTEEGAGLGLAISRDLARGMGGDLTVESEPGVGSSFRLTLLRVREPAGAVAAS